MFVHACSAVKYWKMNSSGKVKRELELQNDVGTPSGRDTENAL